MTTPPAPKEQLDYSLDDPRPPIKRLSRRPLAGLAALVVGVLLFVIWMGDQPEHEERDADRIFRSLPPRTDAWWEGEGDGVVVPPAVPPPPVVVRKPTRSVSLQTAMDAPLMLEVVVASAPPPLPIRAQGGFSEAVAVSPRSHETNATSINSSLELKAGALIPAALMTAIHSDLPGPVLAQVTEDVRDSVTSNHVLVPKGTKLICEYSTPADRGQTRLVVTCGRMVFPDGQSFTLPSEPATDLAGTIGVPGDVNRHLASTFGTAALLAFVSGGVQVSQGTFDRAGTGVREVMAGALGQQLGTAASEILRRDLNRPPTIEVGAGSPLQVMVTQDIQFESAYAS